MELKNPYHIIDRLCLLLAGQPSPLNKSFLENTYVSKLQNPLVHSVLLAAGLVGDEGEVGAANNNNNEARRSLCFPFNDITS